MVPEALNPFLKSWLKNTILDKNNMIRKVRRHSPTLILKGGEGVFNNICLRLYFSSYFLKRDLGVYCSDFFAEWAQKATDKPTEDISAGVTEATISPEGFHLRDTAQWCSWAQ